MSKEQDDDRINEILEGLLNAFSAGKRVYESAKPYIQQKLYDPYSEMLKLADNKDIKEIYKLLSLKLHPDKQNGSNEKMAKLNEAFDKIKKIRNLK